MGVGHNYLNSYSDTIEVKLMSAPIHKLSKYIRSFPLQDVTTDEGKAEGNGWIEGYLAVFNNVDKVGERIMPGALVKSASERIPKGEVPLMVRHMAHGGDTLEVVGIITRGYEDSKGFFIRAEFLSDPQSQSVREKCAVGAVRGLSIGYQVIRWGTSRGPDGKEIVDLLELKLIEGTVTVKPINELAVITSAKGFETMDKFSKILADIQQGKTALSPEEIEVLKTVSAQLASADTKAETKDEVPPEPDLSSLSRTMELTDLETFLLIQT